MPRCEGRPEGACPLNSLVCSPEPSRPYVMWCTWTISFSASIFFDKCQVVQYNFLVFLWSWNRSRLLWSLPWTKLLALLLIKYHICLTCSQLSESIKNNHSQSSSTCSASSRTQRTGTTACNDTVDRSRNVVIFGVEQSHSQVVSVELCSSHLSMQSTLYT